MELSEEDRERLADIVSLQPTKNGELQDRWGLESGSEVHQYLEGTLGDYYYRDENSLIRATDEAADLVDVKPGVEGGDGEALVLRIPDLEQAVINVLPEPDEQSQSVVATLQAIREETSLEPEVDDVREALQSLRRKGAVDVEYRIVPTYRLAVPRDDITVESAVTR